VFLFWFPKVNFFLSPRDPLRLRDARRERERERERERDGERRRRKEDHRETFIFLEREIGIEKNWEEI